MKNRIALLLHNFGVSADALTAAGLALAGFAGVLLARGSFVSAGLLLLLAGLADLLDGAVARVSGSVSRFGGILDSSLDRYGDAAVIGGAAFYYGRFNETMMAVSLIAMAGSFAVSYVRARAECEVGGCRTGFWERGERLVFLALALLLNNLALALWVLAAGTQWTVFQRLALARHLTRGFPADKAPSWLRASPRTSKAYLLKTASLIAALLLLRVGN